jgi:hypothetical protein
MPSSFTTPLRLEMMASGEDSETWGGKNNTNLQLLEAAIAGRATIAHPDTANYTLTANNGSADEARSMFLNVTGTLTAARNVLCPAATKLYLVQNATSGGFDVTLKTSGGTGIAVASGNTMLLYCDGTNMIDAIGFMNLAGLAVTALTLNGAVTLGSSASLVQSSKDLTTITTGTLTIDPRARPLQHYVNGGAHTLAPSANVGSCIVDITNNGSAGAITTSGFTRVTGDFFTTTNTHKFRCHISVGNNGSLLNVLAFQ